MRLRVTEMRRKAPNLFVGIYGPAGPMGLYSATKYRRGSQLAA